MKYKVIITISLILFGTNAQSNIGQFDKINSIRNELLIQRDSLKSNSGVNQKLRDSISKHPETAELLLCDSSVFIVRNCVKQIMLLKDEKLFHTYLSYLIKLLNEYHYTIHRHEIDIEKKYYEEITPAFINFFNKQFFMKESLEEKERMIYLVGLLKGMFDLTLLKNSLESDNKCLRNAALFSLSYFYQDNKYSNEVYGILLNLLNDNDKEVVGKAIIALSHFNRIDCIRPILGLLKQEDTTLKMKSSCQFNDIETNTPLSIKNSIHSLAISTIDIITGHNFNGDIKKIEEFLKEQNFDK